MTNSPAESVVQLRRGAALLCPWARCFTGIASVNTQTQTHTHTHKHSLYKCDVTDQRISTLIHFSASFFSLKICPEEMYRKIGYWHYLNECFQARGEVRLTAPSGSLKNQRTADEKLGWSSLATMREKTQEMNSDLWSQFQHFHRTLLTVSGWKA